MGRHMNVHRPPTSLEQVQRQHVCIQGKSQQLPPKGARGPEPVGGVEVGTHVRRHFHDIGLERDGRVVCLHESQPEVDEPCLSILEEIE
jgi:hypothetical protein